MRVLLFLIGLTLFAQQPSLAQQPARIEGRVIDSEGKPVPRATVMVGLLTDRQPVGTQSADDGSFIVDGLTPGPGYLLAVQKPGYLPAAYGANTMALQTQTPNTFTLAPGEILRGIEIKMAGQGVITGRVTDAAGDPVVGALVRAPQTRYQYGEKITVTNSAAQTDDQGNFRIANLPAGRYTLATTPRADLSIYFGGTLDPALARTIEITPGAEFRADIQIVRPPAFAVRGKLIDESGSPLTDRGVRATRVDGVSLGITAPTDAQGNFMIRGLLPGEYVVEIRPTYNTVTGEPMRVLLGSTRVVIGAADAEGVIVRTSPGATVRGTVIVEGAAWKPAPADATQQFPAFVNGPLLTGGFVPGVRAFAAITQPGAPLGVPRPAPIAENGAFEIVGVAEGDHQLTIGGFPEDYYLKSVHLGDADVTHSRLSLPGADLKVLMSAKGASISGAMPREGITLVLWPEGGDPGRVFTGMRSVTSGKNGTFRFPGLAPGTYRIAAFDTTETGVLWNFVFTSQFAPQAQLITVQEAEQATAEPSLIPSDLFQQAFANLP